MINSGEKVSGIIERGCSFDGNLSFSGVLRIAGEFTGKIFTNDTLVLSDEAIVNAEIFAGVVIISGKFKGTVKATSRVEIKRPAKFEGSIISPSLLVEEGVIFKGETKVDDIRQ